jgi:cytochrome c
MRFALLTALALLLATDTPAFGQKSKQVAGGARLFAEACAVCHGDDGRAGAGYQTPIWGEGAKIQRFETALGLFEYNQMMMPFDDPTKLTDEEKWAIVAYMLFNHGAIPAEAELGPNNAASVSIR